MQSRLNSALIVFLFSLAIFILPPVFVLSGSMLALIVMRQGIVEAAIVVAIVVGILLLIGFMLGTTISPFFMLGMWLPVLLCGQQIKSRGTLNAIFLPLTAVMFGYWLLIYFGSNQNPPALWLNLIDQYLIPTIGQIDSQSQAINYIQANKNAISQRMNASIILLSIFLTTIHIIIGRNWQARLYNPGGFAQEFRLLEIGKPITSAGLIMICASIFTDAWLFSDLQLAIFFVFTLQGLAIIHALLKGRNAARLLLILTYLTLFLMPIATTLVAIIGAADAWADFRQKFGKQNAA